MVLNSLFYVLYVSKIFLQPALVSVFYKNKSTKLHLKQAYIRFLCPRCAKLWRGVVVVVYQCSSVRCPLKIDYFVTRYLMMCININCLPILYTYMLLTLIGYPLT